MLQAMHSKPGSRGSALLGLDLDDDGSVGGREAVLSAKLMDDEPDVIVRLAHDRMFAFHLNCSLFDTV